MTSQPHIVCLDECHCEIPTFSPSYTYKSYSNTQPDQVSERVEGATIVIVTRVQIPKEVIQSCSPELKLIAVMAAGYDGIDIEACRAQGITVCNIPSASAESVAEHAITLYLSVKRRVVELNALTREGVEWPKHKTAIHRFGGLPRTCRSETMGIIGYGTLGERLERIAKALGMSVLISERKGVLSSDVRKGRTEFTETLEKSDVIILCCPLNKGTRSMIGEAELRSMNERMILVNVSRGGVVEEGALAKALKESWIAGAATDVFAVEPATSSSSPLLVEDIPNLTLSPHVAWYADSSIENLQKVIKSNVEAFLAGEPTNVVS